MQNLAAIDVGSNAIRLLIGRLYDNGKTETLDSLRVPVRLGKDTFKNGIISEGSMQELLAAFTTFKKVIHDNGVSQVRAVSTSAMREAANQAIVCDRILHATGITVDVISGEEEARLIHLAVSKAIDLHNSIALLIDIGGGSMETTLSENGNILFTESYKVGAVRLLSQFSQQEKPGALIEDLVREYIEASRRLIQRRLQGHDVTLLIGTGGNVEEIGELAHKLFGRRTNRVISMDDLEALIARMSRLSYEERIRQLGLRPDRADVIVPAAILLKAIADETNQQEISIPRVSLKDGLLADLVEQIMHGANPARREQVWVSIQRLGSKYEIDEVHARHVAELACRIFEQTYPLHNLEPEYQQLLEAAAYLHDIGHFIGTIDHEKHGYYILTANPIIGLSDAQQAIIANLVRSHRRQLPSSEEIPFHTFSQKEHLVVIKLLSILRIADGLDTSRSGRVKDVCLKSKNGAWELELIGEDNLLLEKWTTEKRKNLFCELFGVTLKIKD